MTKRLSILLVLFLLLLVSGCSKRGYVDKDINEDTNKPSVVNGHIVYPTHESLYNDLDNEIFYSVENVNEMYLVSFKGDNGLRAEFVEVIEDKSTITREYNLTSKLKEELLEAGVHYDNEENLGYRNEYSLISFDTTKKVYVESNPSSEYVAKVHDIKTVVKN